MNLLEHFVGGKLISGSSDRKSKIFNPATGEQESEVRLANKADLDQAVEVATSTAWSRSALLANLTSDSCSPVAGLKILLFLSDEPEISFPPTKCSNKFMNGVI